MLPTRYNRTGLGIATITLIGIAAWGCSSFPAADFSAGMSERENAASSRPSLRIVVSNIGLAFPDGLNENANPYLDYIKAKTDMDIHVTMHSTNGYEDMLNVIMSSGKLPDMLNAKTPEFLSYYVRKKALQPLDGLIDKYGPDLKRLIPKEAWRQVTVDGNIYAIPSLNEAQGVELMYARKDWLDKLGLEPPRTLEEYAAVMRAFTESDPDGNGKKDTYGISFTENMGRTAPLLGAFNTQLNAWYERNGKLVYSGILPETKEALAFLAGLYKDGVVDPEFPLNRNTNFYEKIENGRIGLFSAAWYDTRGPIEANRRKNGKAEWIPLEYPVGKNGYRGVYDASIVRSFNVVPAQSANGEHVVKLLNFIAGEGQRTLKLGFENDIWTETGGQLTIHFEKHDMHGYRGIYGSLSDTIEPAASKRRLDSLGEHFQLWNNIQRIERALIRNRFNGPPTPAMGKYNARLLKYQKELFTRIVVGGSPVDEFDAFVTRWRREGGDEMTREINDWHSGTMP